MRTLTLIFLALEILIFFGLWLVLDYLTDNNYIPYEIGSWLGNIRLFLTSASIIVAICIFNTRNNTSYRMTWLLFVFVFPIFGSFCWILFANKKFTRKEHKKVKGMNKYLIESQKTEGINNIASEINPNKEPDAAFFARYLNNFAHSGTYKNTKVKYYPWGQDAWPVMLDELKQAKHYIFLEYFIIEEGLMWNSMLDILREKVAQGVDVRVLYDDFGCMNTLPSRYFRKLRAFGIKAYAVNPLKPIFNIRLNNRDHRKILVIDGHTGFTGGINLADEYINKIVRFGKWKDNSIMLKGDGVFGLTTLFLSNWNRIENVKECNYNDYLPSKYANETDPVYFQNGYVAPYGSIPFANEAVGEDVYINLIHKAREYIYITTPYLILDEELENALVKAAKGGIKVKLLTPHIPDKKIVFDLTRSHYRTLAEAGVMVYEYTPGFVHAKTFVIDGKMATVGTINLDYRSLFLHLENGCFLYEVDCIKDIEKDMEETFVQSRQITIPMVQSSPVSKRAWRSILKMFASNM